jgi:hypothetical protein
VYNAATLLKGDNLACFLFQATRILVPDAVDELAGAAMVLVQRIVDVTGGLLATLTCLRLMGVMALLEAYPGYRKTTRPL